MFLFFNDRWTAEIHTYGHSFSLHDALPIWLESIVKKVGGENWLYDIRLSPQAGAVTVLLGATQACKTSLMRIMAGLDTPNVGKVLVDGNDVTGDRKSTRLNSSH